MEVLAPCRNCRATRCACGNFATFSYTAADKPIPRYEERTYDLAKLSSLDYFLSHWSGPVMAHTLVSFGFDDGQFLCVSVEARRQRWQSYSPLWGLFRSYQLMFVLGDERDIVRLRTNIRRDRVYMYRLRLPRRTFATTASRLRQPSRDAGQPNPLGTTPSPATARPIFFTTATPRAVVDETGNLPEWVFCPHDVSTRLPGRQPAVQGIASTQ